MNTLFIDTHGEVVVLAIYTDEKLMKKKESKERKDHSTICMPLLVELLTESKLDIKDINDIVVVNGPGSFTGVRIGVTIAKTLAFTLNIPIRMITSLELYLDTIQNQEYLVLNEKNGYYTGKIENKLIIEYEYIKTSEFDSWALNKNIVFGDKINYENLIVFAHQKEETNPHVVNPFYVKKIEVENDKRS